MSDIQPFEYQHRSFTVPIVVPLDDQGREVIDMILSRIEAADRLAECRLAHAMLHLYGAWFCIPCGRWDVPLPDDDEE